MRALLTLGGHNSNLKLRFLAPEIAEVIFLNYFEGRKSRGQQDKAFLTKISGAFICLTATVIHHLLKSWKTGIYVKPGDFKTSNRGVYSKLRTLFNAGVTIR